MHLDSSIRMIEKEKFKVDNELSAPIANMDIEDWLDLISVESPPSTTNDCQEEKLTKSQYLSSKQQNNTNTKSYLNTIRNRSRMSSAETRSSSSRSGSASSVRSGNGLLDSIDLCNSLEDLVKTFDKSVKECLRNYKNIDIGQLAPVQVRTQEDLVNDSQ